MKDSKWKEKYQQYKEDSSNKEQLSRFKRIGYIGIALCVFGLLTCISSLINQDAWFQFIWPALYFLIGVVFILKSREMLFTEVNIWAYSKKYHSKTSKK